jgi:predicted RNA-binding protein with TRAM domain
MTRQNVTDGPREILTKKCPTCEGDGIVVSEATAAMEVERRLRALASGSRAQAFRVEVAPRTASLLLGPGGARLAEIEAAAKKRFFLVPKEGAHADHAAVLAEGKLDDLRPEAPVEEGKELQLQLVELGLHDAHAAVGKLDGLDVVVGGAAKLVGKKAKVRIERVLDGTAYASLLAGGTAAAEPITFESEAEKPTRAPARAKKAEEPSGDTAEAAAETDAEVDQPDAEEAAAVPVAETGEAEPATDDEAAEAEVGETPDDGAPAKKKTRRGSRGGRGRKKKATPAGSEGEEDGDEEPEVTSDEQPEAVADEQPAAAGNAAKAARPARKRAPRIHVPRADLGEPADAAEAQVESRPAESQLDESQLDESQPAEIDPETGEPKPKRKTRRGSRGGRGRKKKPATATSENGAEPEAAAEADAEADTVEPESAPEPEPAAGEADATPAPAAREVEPAGDDYVPMSEWLDELEAETR